MPINPHIGVLFGYGSDGSTVMSGSERIGLYKQTLKNEDKATERLSKDVAITRDLDRLQKAIDKAETPEELLKDPVARRVLLESFGLAGQENNTGLAVKALTADLSKSGNLPSRLTNKAWAAAAETLDFFKSGLTKLRDPTVFAEIRSNYIEYKRVDEVSTQSQPVADALHVRSMEDKTPGVYNILGDKILRRVALTLAGLPEQIAFQSIESQARQLEKRLDLDQFATPEGREKLIQRYLVMAGDEATSASLISYTV
ncbi:DUF1217 domain-containing protein [Pseudoroseomonas cervicalis]|uniref:DUF1217 domain-containing protein n=1 Tax=Teichococcus cervicalis TaxID=204525 RepID=UPI002789A90F|nr:DUF1217 domain-containing protein [Pseudoroseomonas cervicalis]MDQ1079506.1 hypothetical protein [Pseudoroseomonas cervicalis]